MCGRYYVDDDTLDEIEKVVKEIDDDIRNERISKDIHPTEKAPVIVNGEQGMRLTSIHWGYPGINNKGVIFNARSETVLQKRMFIRGIKNTRAVIPVKLFYEWNKSKEKNMFTRGDNEILYLAGFYDNIDGDNKFIIITTQANDSMKCVHDRMPLILEKNQIEEWLRDDSQIAKILSQVPVMLNRISEYEQQSLEL